MSSLTPPEDRRPPITPQLAMRVAILGGVALAMFAIVFFRLWFLQVLSGEQYLAQASTNRVRDVMIQAPRGEMIDRTGTPLVENRRAVAVVVSPPKLPQGAAARVHELARLSGVLGMSTQPRRCKVGRQVMHVMEVDCLVRRGVWILPYADVTVRTDVPSDVAFYLAERQQEFPGVTIPQVFLRSYPYREVGAQLFGTIGQVDPGQLKQDHYRGVRGGTLVGQSGLEYTYDRYLRGADGAQRVQVDALGNAKGYLRQRAPVPGANLRLSLDLRLQKAGQAALATGIGLANQIGHPSQGGAFVALDPRNGEVLAMGSAPTYDANLFAKPLSQQQYDAHFGPGHDDPLINRAIAADYPVGSTFKVVTAAAALANAIITPDTPYTDTGEFRLGAQVRHNAGGSSYGTVTLRNAISYSVDTFFYWLGDKLNADPASHPDGGELQAWARKLGFGSPTGIDLGGEHKGTIPTPRRRDDLNRTQARCVALRATSARRARRLYPSGCVFADGTNRPWTVGDNVSLAIGQGDFLATPLQLAVAYAAIENGGTVVRPHLGLEIADPNGRVLQQIDPKAARHVDIPNVQTIQDGLYAAANSTGGTSVDVFAGFPSQYRVHGKTGTASFSNRADQSWYVAYVPDAQRPIVVAATIESGGFGAQSAAPTVRLILSQWFGVKKQVVTGSSHTL
ncbi:MAG TPA: penicillin-binding protein 2 [Conexibacter sp.]|jgi:penicillin-binding protein 2|nr:penicillin-binding protein 2 [Conexibacter sp.]